MWLQDRIDVSTNLRSYDLKLTMMSMRILLVSLSKLASWQTCQHQPCMTARSHWRQYQPEIVHLKLTMMRFKVDNDVNVHFTDQNLHHDKHVSTNHARLKYQPEIVHLKWWSFKVDYDVNVHFTGLPIKTCIMTNMSAPAMHVTARSHWHQYQPEIVRFKVGNDVNAHFTGLPIKTCIMTLMSKKVVPTPMHSDCKIALTSVPTWDRMI